MKNKAVACLLFQLFCLFLFQAKGEDRMTAVFQGDIIGFGDNAIVLVSPERGEAEFQLSQGERKVRKLAFSVDEGYNTLLWDGLGEWEEFLDQGPVHLEGTVTGKSGTSYAVSGSGTAGKANQHVLYALPVSDELYAGEEWSCETALVRPGRVQMDVYSPDGELVVTKKAKLAGTPTTGSVSWNGRKGKSTLPEGVYHIRIFPEGDETGGAQTDIRLLHERADEELPVTDEAAVEKTDDLENLWNDLIRPVVVADIAAAKQQPVRAEPKSSSRTVGRVYGQTELIEILGTEGKWARVRVDGQNQEERTEGYIPLSRLKIVQPCQEYALVVDASRQTLTVFREGKILGSMPVSFDQTADGRVPAGSYLTGLHAGSSKSNGYLLDCILRYSGKSSIRREGYKKKEKIRNYSELRDREGRTGNSGDILIPDSQDGTINAYWLWTHIPANCRLEILGGAEETLSSTSGAIREQAATQGSLEEVPSVPVEHDYQVRVTLAGTAAFADEKDAARLEMLKPFFSDDDATVVLLDTVVSDTPLTMNASKGSVCRSYVLKTLKEISVEAVSLTTEHYADYQGEGRFQTRSSLRQNGIGMIGDGNLFAAGTAFRVGFTGLREEEFLQNQNMLMERIREVSEKNCDVAVCLLYCETPAVREEMAEAAVEAGSSLVICCGRGAAGGIQKVNGVPVILNPGCLMGDAENDTIVFTLSFLFQGHHYAGVCVEPQVLQWNTDQIAVSTGENAYEQFTKDGTVNIQKSMWFEK